MNKVAKASIGALVVLVIILTALLVDQSKTQTELVIENNKEPIKIGATLALSGNLAFIGEGEQRGLQMALEEINLTDGVNGRQLELVIEDNAGDTKSAVSSVTKLLEVDDVDIVFSAFTHITQAVKEIVAQHNKPMLYVSTLGDIATENSLFFRDYFDAYDSGLKLAQTIGQHGYKKVALLSEVSDLCMQYEDAISKSSRDYGYEIIARQDFVKATKDLRSQLTKLKASEPDAIIACTWRHEPIFMKQLQELDMMDIQTFHLGAPFLPSGDTRELRELYEANKTISSWYGFTESGSTKEQKKFIQKYQTKYEGTPRSDVAYAYDDMYVLAEAFERCDKRGLLRDSKCLSEELLKTDYEGIGGRLTFDENGVSNRPVTAIQMIDGKWTEI